MGTVCSGFPLVLTLDGYPTSPANYAQRQCNPPENWETLIPMLLQSTVRYISI